MYSIQADFNQVLVFLSSLSGFILTDKHWISKVPFVIERVASPYLAKLSMVREERSTDAMSGLHCSVWKMKLFHDIQRYWDKIQIWPQVTNEGLPQVVRKTQVAPSGLFLVAWTGPGVDSSDSFWNHIGFKKLTPRIHFETAVVSMPMKLQSPISPLFVLKPVWFQNESEESILTHRGVSNCIRPGDYFLAWWHPPGLSRLSHVLSHSPLPYFSCLLWLHGNADGLSHSQCYISAVCCGCMARGETSMTHRHQFKFNLSTTLDF